MPQGKNQILSGGRELSRLNQMDSMTGSLLSRIITAINNLADNIAVSPVGKLSPPDPINSHTVSGTLTNGVMVSPSETLHFTLTHNAPVKKGVQYISEIDTDPNFPQPHVIDHGASRSAFVHLPALASDGVTQQTYYLRSYAQYHGSDPSEKTTYGGRDAAIPIQLTPSTGAVSVNGTLYPLQGATGVDILPSTGSGTASPDGQQGGKGLGTVNQRPAPGPKRNLK